MSDYADGIVERAMQHTLVLDDAGQPELTVTVAGVVFARCSEGCSVSAGVMAMKTGDTVLDVYEAETRHRLYAAVTETTEHLRRVGQLGVPVPEARNHVELFEERPAIEYKAGDPCPTCGAAMVQMQGGVECLSDHK